MIENPKNANISNKVKTNSGFHCFAFLFHASSSSSSVWFELALILAQRCVSPVQRSVLGFSSAVSVWMEVGSPVPVLGLILVLVRWVGVRCG